MTTSALIPAVVASTDVLHWRAEQLEAAGYREADVLRLAERAEVDLHLATSLLEHGCPAATALRILL
jgi:hypothetical protein